MLIKIAKREIKYKDCECCLEYTNIKDDLILQQELPLRDGKLKEEICQYMQFPNLDINKFILFFQKTIHR